MIRYNFERIFRAKGIDKPYSYLVRSGFSENFSTRVKNNKIKMLSLEQLERLCIVLRCSPNDLLEWQPDKHSNPGKDHPLNALFRPGKMIDMGKTLHSIPLDRIEEIEALINERINAKSLEKNQAKEE